MAYSEWSVVYGEQPSASKWNILGTNDASFNDGTGIGAVIGNSHLLTTEGDLGGVWKDYVPTVTGFSGSPTVTANYTKIGKTVILNLFLSGTSNLAYSTLTLPIDAVNADSIRYYFPVKSVDNSAAMTVPSVGYLQPSTDATKITIYKDWAGGAFTTSGTKSHWGQVIYQVA